MGQDIQKGDSPAEGSQDQVVEDILMAGSYHQVVGTALKGTHQVVGILEEGILEEGILQNGGAQQHIQPYY